MKISYSKNSLKIKVDKKIVDFDINKDIDINDAREKFNQAIGKLATKIELDKYLLSRTCERNTLTNDFFLDFCYIKLIEKLSFNYSNIEVYTNKCSIYQHFKTVKSIKISKSSILLFQLNALFVSWMQYLKFIKMIFEKLLLYVKIKKACRTSKQFVDLNNTTIIQTWVSDNNFSGKDFNDSYYNGLCKYLDSNNRKCIVWPVFYNVKNVKKAVQHIRKNNGYFLLPEDHLKWFDYFILIKHFLRVKKICRNCFIVNGRDFSNLFNFYLKTELPSCASLAYKFIQRLAKKKFEDITLILNHENMVVEKAMLLARDKFMSDLRVWGYFHTTKPRNQLCLEYANFKEYKIVPKPDKVIFNSSRFCSYYSQKYPELTCQDGYAFKQAYIENMFVEEGNRYQVLVLLSGKMSDSLLVVDLLNTIANKIGNFHFIFRYHPMNIFKLKNTCKLQNFSVSYEPLPKLYSRVKKVICPYSACLVEASLAGKDVAFIYNPKSLLLNPFDDTGIENYKLVAKSNELLYFLRQEPHYRSVANIFNADPKNLSAFLSEEDKFNTADIPNS